MNLNANPTVEQLRELVRRCDDTAGHHVLAEAEVGRLNALNGEKGAFYWWQYTRLFPDGQSAGSKT